MSETSLNVRDVVKFFGGPAQLARSATANGNALTAAAIDKWQQRNQIPGAWLVRLSAMAKSGGRVFELHDFMGESK